MWPFKNHRSLDNKFEAHCLKDDIDRGIPQFIEQNKDSIYLFDVGGAGVISISKKPNHMSGKSYGFGLGVSWGKYGLVGGALGINEAKRLAEFILEEVSKLDKTEDQLHNEMCEWLNNV